MTIKEQYKEETGLEVFHETLLKYNTDYVLWLEKRAEQLIIAGVVGSTCKKEQVLEVLENRRKEAFDDQFHKYENNEMLHAITIVERLLPPTE